MSDFIVYSIFLGGEVSSAGCSRVTTGPQNAKPITSSEFVK
jgi:hypothetical protein